MEKEIRNLPSEEAEVRADKDSRTIQGYGIIFDKKSKDLGGFKEIILPEAIDGVIEKSDVLALMNHSESRGVLARSTNGKGTMELTPDKKGVKYKFDAPNFDLGEELLEGVRRGDIRNSSFAFSVDEGQKWEKLKDGTYLRTIFKFDEIYDMSPCYRAAYQDTSVAIRSLDVFKGEPDLLELDEVKPGVADTTPAPITYPTADELSDYYCGLRGKIAEDYSTLENEIKNLKQ